MALDLASCSALGLLIERQRVAWPEHGPFLERSYGERGPGADWSIAWRIAPR